MFIYSLRIFDFFHQPATSLAILCDEQQTWRPTEYIVQTPGSRHHFEFTSVKLLDYRDRWDSLETSENPFALVVMAHLKTQETRRQSEQRKVWKLNLVRRLYEFGYSRADVLNLFKFIDWIMILPEGLKQSFWEELQAFEQERRMPYITSVEQIGFERGQQLGKQAGREEGREEARRSLALKMLQEKIDLETISRITEWSLVDLEQLQVTQLPAVQLPETPSDL